MTRQDRVILRRYQDASDYDTIADIRNNVILESYGDEGNIIESKLIARTSSAEQRICFAEVNGSPIGYIYVLKKGTLEGEVWTFTGPTCLQSHENSRIVEERLLKWLLEFAQEEGISSLVRRIRALELMDRMDQLYAPLGFREVETMLNMKLSFDTPPLAPSELPDGMQLKLYAGIEDFDLIWTALKSSFEYEDEAASYDEVYQFFHSASSIFAPIYIESSSQRPVGTIASAEMGSRQGQVAFIATFGVNRELQGRGIGSSLIQRTLYHLWENGMRIVELVVKGHNQRAIRVYERFGFKINTTKTMVTLRIEL
ncbi:MAG: GNAT family N-acetyltransferase [Candidatus Thorarchaeota archaeon]